MSQLFKFIFTIALILAPIISHSSQTETSDTLKDQTPQLKPPASFAQIAIMSGGSRMNGLIYQAAGKGPHPVVIFLHGFPGYERNLDLAQAVRRAGYQALYFDYRGTWSSGGRFSFGRGLEDLAAVLAWVRNPKNAKQYNFNTRRIALLGDSYGGWLSFMSVEHEPPDICIAGLAAWNISWDGKYLKKYPKQRKKRLHNLRISTNPNGGPVNASAEALMQEMIYHADDWNYLLQAIALKDHALLLFAATRDTPDEGVKMQKKLKREIEKAGGKNVQLVIFDDDHAFSSHRIELADKLIHWLNTDCAAKQKD